MHVIHLCFKTNCFANDSLLAAVSNITVSLASLAKYLLMRKSTYICMQRGRTFLINYYYLSIYLLSFYYIYKAEMTSMCICDHADHIFTSVYLSLPHEKN